MKSVRAIAVFLVLSLGAAGAGCKSRPGQAPGPRSVTAMETQGLLRNGFAILLDVREESEQRASGVATPARSLPASRLSAEAATLPRDQEIVVYSGTSDRAREAAEVLSRLGLRAAHLGTLEDWRAAKLPVKPFP